MYSACPGRGLNKDLGAKYAEFKKVDLIELDNHTLYNVSSKHKMPGFFSCKNFELVTTVPNNDPPLEKKSTMNIAKSAANSSMSVGQRVQGDRKKSYVVSVNIEDTIDPSDAFTWATEAGLQTKPQVLLQHEN